MQNVSVEVLGQSGWTFTTTISVVPQAGDPAQWELTSKYAIGFSIFLLAHAKHKCIYVDIAIANKSCHVDNSRAIHLPPQASLLSLLCSLLRLHVGN